MKSVIFVLFSVMSFFFSELILLLKASIIEFVQSLYNVHQCSFLRLFCAWRLVALIEPLNL